MTEPLNPHPEIDKLLDEIAEMLPEEPTQTDNRPREEDGDQDVDQKITAPGGSPS